MNEEKMYLYDVLFSNGFSGYYWLELDEYKQDILFKVYREVSNINVKEFCPEIHLSYINTSHVTQMRKVKCVPQPLSKFIKRL